MRQHPPLSSLRASSPSSPLEQAFRSPEKTTVDRREDVQRLLIFALLGTIAGSGDTGAQFKGLSALIDGNVDRVFLFAI
jgi:hypothetical protein